MPFVLSTERIIDPHFRPAPQDNGDFLHRICQAARDRGENIEANLNAVMCVVDIPSRRNVSLEVYAASHIFTASLCRAPSLRNLLYVKIFNNYRGAVRALMELVPNTIEQPTTFRIDSGITVECYDDLDDGVSFTCRVDADQYQLAAEFITNIVDSALNILR